MDNFSGETLNYFYSIDWICRIDSILVLKRFRELEKLITEVIAEFKNQSRFREKTIGLEEF